jgi:sugar porter (SP) family MFS transporter
VAYNKSHSFFLSLIVAFGGFIFGFDASVISGAIGQISNQYNLSPIQQGLVVGAPTLGAIIAASVVGYLSDYFGRKKMLILIAALYLASIVGSACAVNYNMLIAFRFLGGLAFASLMIAPLYIAEVSPASLRGKFVSLNQLNIVIGFSVAYFSNYWFLSFSGTHLASANDLIIKQNLWRWMLGVEALPALIYFLILFVIPETPRWLILNNRKDEAKKLLSSLVPEDEANEQLLQKPEQDHEASFLKKLGELLQPKMRFIMGVGIFIGVIQQVTGVNAIYFYAPTIFEQSGIGTNAAFAQAIWIGIINIAFTLVAIAAIDRFGRRPLMIAGLVGVIVSMGLCGYGFANTTYELTANNLPKSLAAEQLEQVRPMIGLSYDSDVKFKNELKRHIGDSAARQHEGEILQVATKTNPTLILLGIFGFVAAFAVSLGPVMWVMLSEIFPNALRGVAIAFVGVINSIASFAVQLLFPWQLANMGSAMTFIVYGVFALVGLIVVLKYLPETKGKTLEQLETVLMIRH